jgi:hypothetical protein
MSSGTAVNIMGLEARPPSNVSWALNGLFASVFLVVKMMAGTTGC